MTHLCTAAHSRPCTATGQQVRLACLHRVPRHCRIGFNKGFWLGKDAALIQPYGSQVFAFGEIRAASFIQFMQQEYVRQYRTSGFPEQGAGREESEDWEGDWDEEQAPNEWYESAVLDLVVDLIGVRMQMVEAAEEEIPARREMERMLVTVLVPRVGNMARWRRMESFDKGWRAGEHWQKEK